MSEVTITVRGEHEARVAPERATVRVSLRTEGAERQDVVSSVMQLAEPIRSSIAERAAGGVVIEWSSTQLGVRAERPWNSEGKRLAPVYHASVDFTATFAEASELSLWVTDVSASDGVEVGWVDWHLTAATRTRVEQEVAAEAVRVAAIRARAYAGAIGLKDIVPVEIADVGLISTGQPPQGAPLMKARGGVAFAADAAPAMEYEPQEIVLSATVEARFLAR
ncbi:MULTISPECIES: SIMPL domain-containing protein [unclassified Microbacterium]|uniref:SIMPL domain-containing protein n=1 Tax=unclassified Microbacterium TaxID=2609290 RepID=UPI001604F5A6|nr:MULTISPECIES: SIMPL domain-containing protein [unclassified Microbacterium]QNA92464.1 SIMPL domain-containing protein [Microbacterium sp. Se63.02b]QYM65762.1 SIMPL domain-containing protein [Microbacterium sp. Se5.02b]